MKPRLTAWNRVKKNLTARQRRVAVEVRKRKRGATIRDIAKALRVTPNVISGRFTDLEKEGVFKVTGVKYYEGSQPHSVYEINKKYKRVS
jgi:predicted ArsR family transcriptional regulator